MATNPPEETPSNHFPGTSPLVRKEPVLEWLVHLASALCRTPYALVLRRTASGEQILAAWGWKPPVHDLPQRLLPDVYRADAPVVTAALASNAGRHALVSGPPSARYAAGMRLTVTGGDGPLALVVLDGERVVEERALHADVLKSLTALPIPIAPGQAGIAAGWADPALFESLLDAIPAPIFLKDAEYRYLACNEAFARDVLGRPAAEVIGKSVYDLAPADLAHVYDQADHELMSRGGVQRYESRVRLANGDYRDAAFHKAVFTDKTGAAAGIVGVVLDISARREAEDALRESEMRFRTAFDNLPFDFWVTDTEGRYVMQNATSITNWGYQIGRRPEDIGLPEDLLASWKDNNRRALSGETIHSEVACFTPNEEERYCFKILAPVRDEEGEIHGVVGTNIDITERRRAEQALERSELHFKRFVNHAVDAFFLHDADGTIKDVNASACRRLGYDRAELTSMNIKDIDVDFSPAQLHKFWEGHGSKRENEAVTRESRHRARTGEVFPVELRVAMFHEDGEKRFLVLASDVTERKRNESMLRERERIFRSVFHASEDAMLILDGDTFIDCNDATVRMLRCRSKKEILPSPPWVLSPEYQPDGRLSTEKAEDMIQTALRRHFHRFEWIHRRADGEDFPVEVTLTTADLDGRRVLYVVWNDITERKQREQRIEELAHFDPLTQLPNRRLLQDRAQQVLAMADRHRQPVGVMYMDLNRFKDINDTQGHDIGDELLVKVAQRLQHCLRELDTLARWGGDEFAFLLPEVDRDGMGDVAERLLAVFHQPFETGDLSVRLGASIGMVSYPDDGRTLSELLKNADIAMYEAKAMDAGYCAFHRQHAQRLIERVDLERDLRRALDQEELQVHYQPRIDVRDGGLHSVETLARWQRVDGQWISPEAFIPVAERGGLIHALGQAVLREACRQCRVWRDSGVDVRVAVNVSALELQRDDFVESTMTILTDAGLEGRFLEVEITETAAMDDAESNIKTLTALKANGVHVAIDDFGTGYSSLSYLKRLPVDCLKVDSSFIRDMMEDPTDLGIVETIVDLARSMDISTVAEGVETVAQFRKARDLGCDAVQGYLFAKPGCADTVTSILRQRWAGLAEC